MQDMTLGYILKGDQVLLGRKKRGFGEGKWNGFGGKVEPGEGIIEGAIREAKEGFNIDLGPHVFDHVAVIHFSYLRGNQDLMLLKGYVFLIEGCTGEPQETEELLPKWFHRDRLPFDRMWVNDKFWVPRVLDGRKLFCEFRFDDQDNLLHHTVADLPESDIINKKQI